MEIKILKNSNPEIIEDIKSLVSQLKKNPDLEKVPESIKEVIDNPNCYLMVTEENNKIVGMATLCTYPLVEDYRRGWIEGVVVDENFRRMGIGEILITALIKEAKKRKIRTVNLRSSNRRVGGNKLYQKLGFQKIDTNLFSLKTTIDK